MPCHNIPVFLYNHVMWQVELMLRPIDNRASFDGRSAMELEPGASIQCQTSECPMPVVNLGPLDHDWYELREALTASSHALSFVSLAIPLAK